MPLKLMFITNRKDVALIAERAGVDRIFVDMEYIGKNERQAGLDTVQSHHTTDDVRNIKNVLKKAELLVRCNPIHDKTDLYSSSQEEIDDIIKSGADIIMLPFFKTVEEVSRFVSIVNGRVKTMLLVETPEAVNDIEKIIAIDGVDEVHIGLNDLSLAYKNKFMFELLTNGTVEKLCNKLKKSQLPYGFGGIAAVGTGTLPAEKIIIEHYRLGSTAAILSRSFCNVKEIESTEEIQRIFEKGIVDIRNLEKECIKNLKCKTFFDTNKRQVEEIVKCISEKV